jgi:hypothetical protein
MKRGVRIGLVLGGMLLLAAAALLLLRPRVAEVVGLAASGGEKQLREPMRAAGTGPRVLVFALDGVGDEALLAAIEGGHMPRVAAFLGAAAGERLFERGYAVPDMLSILPSTTLAAWAALFTGSTPAHNGVPGNEWFAREEARFYAPAPVSVEGTDHALAVYTDDLMGGALRAATIYERAGVRSYVTLSQFHRGADLLIVPSAAAFGAVIAAAAAGLADDDESGEQEAYAEIDVKAVDNLLDAIGRHGVADLQVIYMPGVDLYTHVAEPPLEMQRAYLSEVVDVAAGRVLDLYRRAGALADTYVLFVSDHGHTPVINDAQHALGSDDSAPLASVLQRTGFRVRPRKLELDDDESDYQATFAYQGAFAYVYLADRSTCAAPGTQCSWARPPRFDADVLPVVRAIDTAARGAVAAGTLGGTLDLIFARAPRATTEDALPFQVWDGARLVDIAAYLAQHPRPDLLDLERRLHGLAAGPYGHRAGDVLLLAKSGGARPIEDRYYFSSRYRSWHGSPDAQDSRVPLIVGHGTLDGAGLRQRVTELVGERPNQEDVAGLIVHLLRR